MKKVVSSNVGSIGYCDERSKMFVRFSSGALYEYSGVQKAVFDSLVSSPSVGSALRSAVSGFSYRAVPVNEEDEVLGVKEEVPIAKDNGPVATEKVVEKKSDNILHVLLSYYQGEGEKAQIPTTSITNQPVAVGTFVYSVLVRDEDKSVILPVLRSELPIIDSKYVPVDIMFDEDGYGLPVLVDVVPYFKKR